MAIPNPGTLIPNPRHFPSLDPNGRFFSKGNISVENEE
jgi:hypothetical protein